MNWDDIKNEFETTEITIKALAEKHNVKLGTLKSRKSREKWSKDAPKKDATKKQKVATSKKKDATKHKEHSEPIVESDELTDKQRLFCMYYLKYFNATKAYQKAYECDYRTANVNGSRLLVNASVKKEIDHMKEEQANGLMLDAQFVLQKYIDIAFADITDFTDFGRKEVETGEFDEEGRPIKVEVNYVDFKDANKVDGTIVTEVKQGKEGVSVKLADKMKALDKLWEYFDMLPETYKEKLQSEKVEAETKFIQERTKLIQGEKKDTSLLNELIKVVNEDD